MIESKSEPSNLEHFDTCQEFVKHLLLLEVKPPRWLGVARRASKVVEGCGKFVRAAILPPQGKMIKLVD